MVEKTVHDQIGTAAVQHRFKDDVTKSYIDTEIETIEISLPPDLPWALST